MTGNDGEESLPPAILLMGPTASGKTDLAVALAERFPLEIISVDSAMVFRDMNIGTAKPEADVLARAPHHLIDFLSPTENYSAAQFCHDADRLMAEIVARGRVPLLVGGTMLYFKALREGLNELPSADEAMRRQIDQEAREQGWAILHQEIQHRDPESAARIKPGDSQRIQRALEVMRTTGQTLTELWSRRRPPRACAHWLSLALVPSVRATLHVRIAQRFDAMLAAGLLDELLSLRQRYALHADSPAMRCVGYRQAWAFQEGAYDFAELRERGIFATRQLAKRQLTWLRGMANNAENSSGAVLGFDSLDSSTASHVFRQVAAYLESRQFVPE